MATNDVPELSELEERAEKWWPDEIESEIVEKSPKSFLEETFEEFREQTITANTVDELIDNFQSTDAGSINLFLKHMMLILDVSGEKLQRVYRDRDVVFDTDRSGKYKLDVLYEGEEEEIYIDFDYALSNKRLCVGKGGLTESVNKDGVYNGDGKRGNIEDIKRAVRLLCYGVYVKDSNAASILESFNFIDYIGDSDNFDKLARGRHIAVSSIMKGSEAEAKGRSVQRYVKNYIQDKIDDPDNILEYSEDKKRYISGEEIKSDVEVYNKNTNQLVSIEVSFQITTNSTIERKGNEAPERLRTLESIDSYAAYVVDGEGNFERNNAISRIRDDCHCLTTFSDEELDRLASFVTEKLL